MNPNGPFADNSTVPYMIPWIVFCALAIAIPAYYFLEGRKRFVARHALNRWALDRVLNQVWPLGLVGFVLIGAVAGDMGLFSGYFWHLVWAAWALVLFGYWAYYFAFKYREHLGAYRHQRIKGRYMPPAKPRRARPASAR